MLYKKTGFPEESEIVFCKVTKVLPNAVFAVLEEYDKQGMIHISEVAPGRIRNIRDFVKEGKTVVCKVLKVRQESGQIDLSLRRVSEMQKREKSDFLKQEQTAEKIVEFAATKLKIDFRKTYDEIVQNALKKYESLYQCFEAVAAEKENLERLGIMPEVAKYITEIVIQRMKPQDVELKGTLALSTKAPNGVEIVKEALKETENAGKKPIKITYLGSGKYQMSTTAPDLKTGEKILRAAAEKAISFMEKNKGTASFERN